MGFLTGSEAIVVSRAGFIWIPESVYIMRRLTQMGLADIVFFVFGVFMVGATATWNVKLDSAFLPSAVNGISSVTGILISLTSVMIVFSMNQREGKFAKMYRRHMINSTLCLMFSAVPLVLAYNELVQGSPVSAVKLAAIGMIFAFIV